MTSDVLIFGEILQAVGQGDYVLRPSKLYKRRVTDVSYYHIRMAFKRMRNMGLLLFHGNHYTLNKNHWVVQAMDTALFEMGNASHPYRRGEQS